MIALLALAAVVLNCPPGTKQARQYGKHKCVPVKVTTSAPVPATPDPWKIAPPIVTTPAVDLGSSGNAGSVRSNLHALRAMELYPLYNGGDRITISDVRADRVRAGVINRWRKGRLNLPANYLTLERLDLACVKYCVNLGFDSTGTAIRDARFRPASPDSEYATGIQIDGTAHDVLIERVDSSGFTSTQPKGYPNADGLVTNRGTYNVTIRYSTFADNTDGGLDLKSRGTLLDNVFLARNGRNLRLWDQGTATTVYSDSPRLRHVWVSGKAPAANWRIGRFVAKGPGVLFEVEKGGRLVVDSCDLREWTGTERVRGGGSVTLGEGCR